MLSAVANHTNIALSTATPDVIEHHWEQDVIEQMVMKDRICVVLWIQQDVEGQKRDRENEQFIDRFDTDLVAVFRISTLQLAERLISLGSKLGGPKFDGRIRMVVNVNEPVSIVKQLLTYSYLRTAPVLVSMCSVQSPEDCIYELTRVKADIQFSVKPTDMDKYCSFATVLWINYKEDPSRTVVEKRVSKTGVVVQKTDSVEKGLRYMDAHGHLGYLNDFRIVIGDGVLQLDESTEAALNANKKREFFANRAAAMRARGVGGARRNEEDYSTLELVEVIRNRQKWHTPILIYSYDSTQMDPALYTFKSLKATNSLDQLEYFAMMKALPWTVDLGAIRSDYPLSTPGSLRIINLRCNDLLPKKSSSTLDPYVIVKVGDNFENKTKKISSSLNPTWNLGWDIPCKLTDRISIQIISKNFLGKHEFEGYYDGIIQDLIPVATPLVEVTKLISSTPSSSTTTSSSAANVKDTASNSKAGTASSKDNSASTTSTAASVGAAIPGTLTVEVGFKFDGQNDRVLGRHFGQALEISFEDCIREAVPHLIEAVTMALVKKGLDKESIFRQPTNQKRVDAMKEQIDKGLTMDFSKEDSYDTAFLLRTYLKELPQPLLPSNLYDAFKACNAVEKRRDRLVAISDVLVQLPPFNLEAFATITQLLHEVSSFESTNKMTARNLANVLGPSMIIPRNVETDPSTYLADTTAVASVLDSCITYSNKLFKKAADAAPDTAAPAEKPSATKHVLRTFIDPYLTDTPSPRDNGGGHVKKASMDGLDTPKKTKKTKDLLSTEFVFNEKLFPASATDDADDNEEDDEEYDDEEQQPEEEPVPARAVEVPAKEESSGEEDPQNSPEPQPTQQSEPQPAATQPHQSSQHTTPRGEPSPRTAQTSVPEEPPAASGESDDSADIDP